MLLLLLLMVVMGRMLSGDGRRQWRACACTETWSEGLAALLDTDATAVTVGLCLLSNAEPPCDPLFFELGVELRVNGAQSASLTCITIIAVSSHPIGTELQDILWLVGGDCLVQVLEDGRVHGGEGHVVRVLLFLVLRRMGGEMRSCRWGIE